LFVGVIQKFRTAGIEKNPMELPPPKLRQAQKVAVMGRRTQARKARIVFELGGTDKTLPDHLRKNLDGSLRLIDLGELSRHVVETFRVGLGMGCSGIDRFKALHEISFEIKSEETA
jgi:hypothetical protein